MENNTQKSANKPITHKNRQRRKANARAKQAAIDKQKPLPIEEQESRAAQRAERHKLCYPKPPVYDPYVSVGSWRPPAMPIA